MELLQNPEWIKDYGANVGGSVFLDMPEMGAEGLAEVVAIEPCPPIELLPGQVTATFRHISGEVYDLHLNQHPPIVKRRKAGRSLPYMLHPPARHALSRCAPDSSAPPWSGEKPAESSGAASKKGDFAAGPVELKGRLIPY